jgi:hypothetical protein
MPLRSRRTRNIFSMSKNESLEMVFSMALYRNREEKKATSGEMSHERKICRRERKDTGTPEATPAPVKLPIMTWWVERGSFFQLERIINTADTDNAMLMIGGVTSSRFFPTVSMTLWPCSSIPSATKHPKSSKAFFNRMMPHPIEIPSAFEVSLEPIPKAIRMQAARGIRSVIERRKHADSYAVISGLP